jgi:hypothetical protein
MKKILTLLVLIIFVKHSYCQKQRTFGLSANIQGNQLGIAVPIWLSKKFVLEPFVSVQHVESVGTDVGLGLTPKFYFKAEKIAPYIGLSLGVLNFNPAKENPVIKTGTTDIASGLVFGIDYFFEPKFSVGVQTQANFFSPGANSSRFSSNKGIIFNTASAVILSIYF